MKVRKKFVDIIAKFEGSEIVPLEIFWNNQMFIIDKVVKVGMRPPIAGGNGMQYKITVCNQVTYIWFCFLVNKWFVEEKI